jgi:multisubunit Na+/H+ antiporter MnhB subunit
MEQLSQNRKRMSTFFKINLFITIFCIIAVVLIGSYYLSHPEIIGQFFGKVANGFTNAKN